LKRGGQRPAKPSVKRERQLGRPGGAVTGRGVSGAKAERVAGFLLGGDESDDGAPAAARAGEEVDAESATQQVREVEVRGPRVSGRGVLRKRLHRHRHRHRHRWVDRTVQRGGARRSPI